MAIFGYKDRDGGVNMCLTGTVTREPELSRDGKHVRFSMAYAKKRYMTVDCWADSEIGRLAGCIEKGDHVQAVGLWEQWEYEGKQYECLRCDFLTAVATPAAAGSTEEKREAPSAVPGGGGFGEMEDAEEGELPF